MMNLFYADAYRLRKGAAMRNTIIGLFITVAFIAGTLFAVTSDGLSIYLDQAAEAGMSEAEIEELKGDMEEAQAETRLASAAEFTQEMAASNAIPFFMLAVIITIFCADFTAGTYRNTLSHESNRTRVYLAKLLLSACCLVLLCALQTVFSWLIGCVLFGFGGFSAQYFLQTLVGFLLMLPPLLGVTALGHCIIAFTRKSSVTIAVYLVGLTLISSFLQMAAQFRGFSWLALLDVFSIGHTLTYYWNSPVPDLIVASGFGLLLAAVSTAVGIARYRQADLA